MLLRMCPVLNMINSFQKLDCYRVVYKVDVCIFVFIYRAVVVSSGDEC